MSVMQRFNSQDADFGRTLDQLLAWEGVSDAAVQATVNEVIARVRREGDAAVVDFTNRFDHVAVADMAALSIPLPRLQAAYNGLPPEQQNALTVAADRIRRYHVHQRQGSWQYTEADGTVLGQQVMPLDRVGIYVPGGKASYPSSVLMNAIPAKVAGVAEVEVVMKKRLHILLGWTFVIICRRFFCAS